MSAVYNSNTNLLDCYHKIALLLCEPTYSLMTEQVSVVHAKRSKAYHPSDLSECIGLPGIIHGVRTEFDIFNLDSGSTGLEKES